MGLQSSSFTSCSITPPPKSKIITPKSYFEELANRSPLVLSLGTGRKWAKRAQDKNHSTLFQFIFPASARHPYFSSSFFKSLQKTRPAEGTSGLRCEGRLVQECRLPLSGKVVGTGLYRSPSCVAEGNLRRRTLLGSRAGEAVWVGPPCVRSLRSRAYRAEDLPCSRVPVGAGSSWAPGAHCKFQG